MCRALEAIATTSFVAVRERAKGLEGRLMVAGTVSGSVLWMWSVESQDADIMTPCSLL